MLGKKRWMFVRKLKKETTSSSPPSPSPSPSPSSRSPPSSVPRRKLFGTAFKWRRIGGLQVSFFNNVLFKVVSLMEAVVLVFTLAFFYLLCGCHF